MAGQSEQTGSERATACCVHRDHAAYKLERRRPFLLHDNGSHHEDIEVNIAHRYQTCLSGARLRPFFAGMVRWILYGVVEELVSRHLQGNSGRRPPIRGSLLIPSSPRKSRRMQTQMEGGPC